MSENETDRAALGPFSELPLTPAMLANLTQLGYLTMTPIQAASLPLALAGHDLIAQARRTLEIETVSGHAGILAHLGLPPDLEDQAVVLPHHVSVRGRPSRAPVLTLPLCEAHGPSTQGS